MKPRENRDLYYQPGDPTGYLIRQLINTGHVHATGWIDRIAHEVGEGHTVILPGAIWVTIRPVTRI